MNRSLIRSLRFMRRYAGIATLAVFAVFAGAGADLLAPQVLRRVIDTGIVGGQTERLPADALLLIGLAAAGGLAQFAQGYLSARASHGAAYEMRQAIFAKLQTLSFSWHDEAETGGLVTRVTSDVDRVREFTGGGLVQVVSAVVLLLGATAFLLLTNWRLALVAFLTVPATVFILLRFVRRLGPTFKQTQQRLAALNGVLQENIAGTRVVKVFVREPFEAERYRRANEALLEQGLKVRRTTADAFPLLFSTGTLGIALVTAVGAVQVVRGTLTVGELVAFTGYLSLLLQPLFTLGFGAQGIARAGASAERLFEVLDAETTVADAADGIRPAELEGRVEFRGAGLRYPGAAEATLSGIDLAIEPGTSVAIVGATGSGKSSLVSLVPRFYDATEGVVLVDGHDVREYALDALRSRIGVVMQDTVLFSGTIAGNIAYGRPDAPPDAIERAARAAAIHDFISSLAEGYDTRVGERGVTLSGGQRQRIAIARALLIEPRILIMDDSTSAVDAETEAVLRAELETLMHGRTTLVIASRVATVRHADAVAFIEDGRLAAFGTHEELLATDCAYAELVGSQFSDVAPADLPTLCAELANQRGEA